MIFRLLGAAARYMRARMGERSTAVGIVGLLGTIGLHVPLPAVQIAATIVSAAVSIAAILYPTT
jgi:hypothetical protein